MSETDDWLRVDEQTDVLLSLSASLYFVGQAEEELGAWKHVIVNLHSALQGAMVCHLSGTAQVGALYDSSIRKISRWHDRDRRGEIRRHQTGEDEWGPIHAPTSKEDEYPEGRLADAATLFQRLHAPEKRFEAAGAILELKEEHVRSFNKLHDLRNDFSHFTPKGWSIQVSGLPAICIDIIDVIDLIARGGWAFRHLEDEQRVKLTELLFALRNGLSPRGEAWQIVRPKPK